MKAVNVIIIIAGVVMALPLLSQNKQDYFWVMGYGGENSVEGFGGTNWIFSEDSLRLERQLRPANFFVFNFSIADRSTGDLVLYSNGCAVYDSTHQIIPNGDSVNYGIIWKEDCPISGYGHPQGGLIFSVESNEKAFHLLHLKTSYFPVPGVTVGTRHLLYSRAEYDSSLHRQSLVVKDSVVIDTMLQSAHLKSILHADGVSWWVIQPGRYDDRYFTLRMTSSGIDTLFTQVVSGGEMGVGGSGGGQAAFSPNGKLYARFDIVDNGVLIMDFDRQTGKLSNPRRFFVNDETGGITGGCAFSPSSRFLYVTALSKVYQYDLEAMDIDASKQIVAEWDGFIDPFPTNFYLCNLGPDCRIYINSTNGVQSMHVIRYPDRKGLACEVAQHAIKMPTHNAGSLPNFPHYRMDEDWPCDSTIGVKLITSIELPDQRIEFEVGPNPAREYLELSYQLDGIRQMRFELYDMTGMMVRYTTITYAEFSKRVDISGLPPGIYAWRLFNEQGASTAGKVVVE